MILELKNVFKSYKLSKSNSVKALEDVSLTVYEGEFISIQGMSGSGKSTLLNILGLIDELTRGTYCIDGVDTTKLSDAKRSKLRGEQISFVLQDFALINGETAFFNAALPLYLSNYSKKEIKQRVAEAFERLGISDQVGKKIREMSGGQRQRVAIARSLVTRPSVILADEPTGALDQKTSSEVMALLTEVNVKDGISLVLVTHEPHWADMARRKLHMSDGRLMES